MKILFVHEVNYLTKPIYEFHEFPEQLALRGHTVGVFHFPEGEGVHDAQSHEGERMIEGRTLEAVRIRLLTPKVLAGGILGRIGHAVTSYWQIKRVLREYCPDVIVNLAVPTNGWQTVRAAKSLNIPVVFRALDVSHRIRKGIFGPLIQVAEKYVYRNCDYLSANNAEMLAYCSRSAGTSLNGKVHLPPLDVEAFQRGNFSRGRELLGVNETATVILYLGSFFYFSGLERCVAEFARSNTESLLVLVGGGELEGQLVRQVKELGIEGRVTFAGFRAFEDLPHILAAADVAINPMAKSLVSDCALPHKVLQYMASGTPVVSTNLEGLMSTFPGDCGITWRNSPESIIRSAIALAQDVQARATLAQKQTTAITSAVRSSSVEVFESDLISWSTS